MSGSHVRSWYAASVPDFPAQPVLEGPLQADVCILGAGITGLSTALELAEAGLSPSAIEGLRKSGVI